MEAVLEKKESTKKIAKKKITTGNFRLDLILPTLSEKNLEKLADYARYLRWLSIENDEDDDDDGSWADLPLTPEEEEAVRQGRENAKNGKYLTLAEFKERMACGQ